MADKTKEELIEEIRLLQQRIAATDIENKETGQIIKKARIYAESIVETLREPLIVLSVDLKVISANRSFYQTFKVNPEETVGRFIYDLGNGQWNIPALRQLLEDILHKNNVFNDYKIVHNFETIGLKIMLLNARRLDTVQMILLAIEDITEQKKAEGEIEKLAKFPEENLNPVFRISKDGVLLYTNPASRKIILEDRIKTGDRIPEKWIGIIKNVHDSGKKQQIEMELSGRVFLFDLIPVIGSEYVNAYAIEITERKETEETLKRQTQELKQGIEDLLTEKDKLQRILTETIDALASALEKRDPYTAGHQRRVAQLSVAIAAYIGLSEDRIAGLHLASLVHDIGKIGVPIEMLVNPIQLTELEKALIHDHSEIGYNILKDIEFPWPIAQIVLQHHEKIDGSGYPKGLSGEAILLEAKILCVADVIEAMSSHRPYRPAIGIDGALEELSHNKGVTYEPIAVDACLDLFTKKNFKFE